MIVYQYKLLLLLLLLNFKRFWSLVGGYQCAGVISGALLYIRDDFKAVDTKTWLQVIHECLLTLRRTKLKSVFHPIWNLLFVNSQFFFNALTNHFTTTKSHIKAKEHGFRSFNFYLPFPFFLSFFYFTHKLYNLTITLANAGYVCLAPLSLHEKSVAKTFTFQSPSLFRVS